MRSSRVAGLHLGRTPPPVGGVTIHCARVSYGLSQLGLPTPVVPIRSGSPWERVASTIALVARACYGRLPVWIHFSTLSRASALRLAIAVVVMAPARTYLVPHSGTFPRDIYRRGWPYAMLRQALCLVTGAVCFDASSHDALHVLRRKLDLVRGHSFMADSELERQRSEPREFGGTPTVVMSGYPTGIYNYLEAIRAIEILRLEGVAIRLRIFHYGPPDEGYWSRVKLLAGRSSGVNLETGSSAEFFRALRAADLYVRNTSHDSYGVACAEAVYLGTPVLATDVCDRAPGVQTFKRTDAIGLADTIRRGLELPAPSGEEVPNALKAYLEILERWQLVAPA